MKLEEFINLMQKNAIPMAASIVHVEKETASDPAPTPEPEPEPGPSTILIQVIAAKALARFVVGFNLKGFPIMEIYPSNSSLPTERIKYNEGDRIEVFTETVKADGAKELWPIAWKHGDTWLYLREEDVKPI